MCSQELTACEKKSLKKAILNGEYEIYLEKYKKYCIWQVNMPWVVVINNNVYKALSRH